MISFPFWFAAIVVFRSILIIIRTRCFSLTGPICYESAVVLWASIRNLDSTISIDVMYTSVDHDQKTVP